MTDPAQRRIVVGRIGGAYGVKGWLRIASYTDPIGNLLDYAPLELELGKRRASVDVVAGRLQGKGLVAQLTGIADRDEALSWRGADVVVARERLPVAEDDSYYWADLVGLEVVNTDGISLGRVDRLLETGANDVLVIDGERERLVPFVTGQYVKSVDLSGGTITVDWDAAY